VRFDSTGPHNRSWFASHGQLATEEIALIETLLDDAPEQTLKVLALHHHPLPLPEDSLTERIFNAGSSTKVGVVRIFQHMRGRLTADPYWIAARTKRSPNAAASRSTGALRSAVRAFGI
jgi:hypothetical protein